MRGFKICKIFGIDIEIQLGWLIMLGFFIWAFSSSYLPQTVPGQTQASYWFFGTIIAVSFIFVSLLFHELAHSLTARCFDVAVKRITLMLFGGAAQMEGGFKSPKSEMIVAIAGPASSAVLAGILYLAVMIGQGSFSQLLLASLSYLAYINVILAIFNSIPAFPMDGGRVFRSLLWHIKKDMVKATKIAQHTAMAFAILLPMGGFFWGGWYTALVMLLISFTMILPGAAIEYKMAVLQKMKVKEVMDTNTNNFFYLSQPDQEEVCGPDDNLAEVYQRLLEYPESRFFVMEHGKVVGKVDKEMFRRLMAEIK